MHLLVFTYYAFMTFAKNFQDFTVLFYTKYHLNAVSSQGEDIFIDSSETTVLRRNVVEVGLFIGSKGTVFV